MAAPGTAASYAGVNVALARDPNYRSPYGPPPPEALESNANKANRTRKERLFRQLNDPDPKYNSVRRGYTEKTGTKWSNSRVNMLARFNTEQKAKQATRNQALKNFRNAEWAAYVREWQRTHVDPPPGSGIPAQGHPVRIVGGKKTRKRTHKQKNVRHKRNK